MGASSSSRTFDDRDVVILNVAEALSEDKHARRLGLALGIKLDLIIKAMKRNWVDGRYTGDGNVVMLRQWASTIKPLNQLSFLRRALKKAGLHSIEARCFSNEETHPLPERNEQGEDETMNGHMQTLKERLKTRYTRKFSAIPTSPMEPKSRTMLQQIYVGLVMIVLRASKNTPDESIGLKELYGLINNKSEEGYKTRLAFLGKVGVGKETLLSKIAYDWATGTCLQDINLLFFESFQDMGVNRSFGDIVKKHFPDLTEIEGKTVDKYIQNNQRKVAILITNLDEAAMDFKVKNPDNVVDSIVRGDKFLDTPVLITTRPFVADLIQSIPNIHEMYTLIEVQGFTKEGTLTYIRKFFNDKKVPSDSLIQFVNSYEAISEVAHFPVFCSMLCHIWDTESRRKALIDRGTLSQLLIEICFSLSELYSSKRSNGQENEYKFHMKKAELAMKSVGGVAFDGLIRDQSTTSDKCGEPSMDTRTAINIGLLSREKRLASAKTRQIHGKLFTDQLNFPHVLLQEYVASMHLAQIYEDNNSQFNTIVEKTLLADTKKYRNVLFFIVSHGEAVGKAVIEAMCKLVDDVSFIMEVALECQDLVAVDPLKKFLMHRKLLVPRSSNEHIFSAYIFALETYGREVIEEVKFTEGLLDSTESNSERTSRYAKALCNMPNLRLLELTSNEDTTMAAEAKLSQIMPIGHTYGSVGPTVSPEYAKAVTSMEKLQTLELKDVNLHDGFYQELANGASKSKIMTLKHTNGSVGPTASTEYAKAVTAMPHLQTLELKDVKLHEGFYAAIANGASKSKIKTLKHENGGLSATASSNYAKGLFSMPHLQTLELSDVQLGDDFFQPTLAMDASKSKIVNLKHVGGRLSTGASSNYARNLFTMPNLQSLELESVKLDNESFYQTMSTDAAKSKIQVMRHVDTELDPTESAKYAKGLFSMPHLRSLELVRVTLDERFYSAMVSEAPKSKIENLRHVEGELFPSSSHHYARGIFAMPKLKSLELSGVTLSDDFFKSMATEASKSKIEKLRHLKADLGRDASQRYATGLCSMPKLQSLEMHEVKLSDEFYALMKTGASRSKIQMLRMHGCDVNHRILDAMLSLPLRFLRLGRIHLPLDVDNITSKYLSSVGLQTRVVNELALDGSSVDGLWKLGLHVSCPGVTKLTLYFHDEEQDSPDTITNACKPFQHLTELHIEGQRTPDPEEFCEAIHESCHQLTKLSLTRIKLKNEMATEIIQSMKTHPHLANLELDSCGTDSHLDPVIAEVNSGGKPTVKVTHMI